MKDEALLEASANNNKITQAEFDALYLASIDDPNYRLLIDDDRHFLLVKLLLDHGYPLDLSCLNLRNRNFKRADFTGINLDGSDLSGSICDYADFTQVSCRDIKIDGNTQFYKAKLTASQILQLQADTVVDSIQAVELEEAEIFE